MRSKIFAASVGLAFLFSSNASLSESLSVVYIITGEGQILETIVEAHLGTGDYDLSGISVGSSDGDLTIDAPISWYSDTTLNLFADGDITINASITGLNGKVTLNAGGDICIYGDAIVEVDELISSGRIPANRSAPQLRSVFDEDSCW